MEARLARGILAWSKLVAFGVALTAAPASAAPGAPAGPAARRAAPAPSPAGPRPVRIGLSIDGPSDMGREILTTLRAEILALVGTDYAIDMADADLVVGDWTLAGARAANDRMLADPEIDVVIALGLIGSSDLARRPQLPKPAIASYIVDTNLQGIPQKQGTSGVPNLTYVTSPDILARDLDVSRTLLGFTRLVAVCPRAFLDSVPGLAESAQSQALALGVTLTVVPVDDTADKVLAALPADTQAVYIVPLFGLPDAEIDKLFAGFIARNLPSFSLWGRPDLDRGALATNSPRPDYPRRSRRIALGVQRILSGENASELPVLLTREEGLVINMATARAIDFSPSWAALTEADLVNTARTDVARHLTLRTSAEEAVAQNADLAADREKNAAADTDLDRAYAPLLPQVEVRAVGTLIDADRARGALGNQPELSVGVSGRLTQVIYAEPAWANVAIQASVAGARHAAHESLRLDVALSAASAHLDVLRANSLERVRRENLRKTKSNLALARVRSAAGMVGRSEVLRWEAQLASDRRSVIESSAQRNAAEIVLNRVLGHPLEDPFVAEDVSLEDPALFISHQRLATVLDTPAAFRTYREFVVADGLSRSWELEQLDRAIAAAERAQDSAFRSLFVPTFAVQAELGQRLASAGEGTAPPASLAGLLMGEPPDGTTWSLSLVASLPLWTGLDRLADLDRADHTLAQRKLERRAVAEKIEQNIRAALHLVGASYPAIALTRDAARAARENLEIVTDAYSKGAVQIVVLLDAQNAALLADEAAANALYSFLLDHLRAERAAGWYDFLASPDEAREWLQRFETHRASAGAAAAAKNGADDAKK